MRLRLGVSRRDVSPHHPVQLAGFGRRAGALVSEIANPIHVRVAVAEHESGRLALVSGEFLNWSSESDARFRQVVAEGTGVEPHDVLFSATHTHSSPQLSHHHVTLLGVVDERYLDELETHLAVASTQAAGDLREVTMSRSTGRFNLAWQRRAELDLAVDPAPPRIDDRVTVIRFHDDARRLTACFVHYACHPVVSADNIVSGDFFGVAVATVERATGSVAFPLQGCAGDVDPAGAVMAGVERANAIGHNLADAVLALLAQPEAAIGAGPLHATWATAELPFISVATIGDLVEAGRADGLPGQWARALLEHPGLVRTTATCRLQLWSLGPRLRLLGINGEVTSEYGLRVRDRSADAVLPVAYSNGMIGYIPTARQIAAGGYEVHESAQCYLLPGPFDPSIEQRMNDAIDTLLSRVGSTEAP